jgi:excinuclease ABC subunit C
MANRTKVLPPLSHTNHRASSGGDDFGMMLEMLKRRFRRGKEDADLPDLLSLMVEGAVGDGAYGDGRTRDRGVDAVGLAKMRVQAAARSAEIERSEERVFLRDKAIR